MRLIVAARNVEAKLVRMIGMDIGEMKKRQASKHEWQHKHNAIANYAIYLILFQMPPIIVVGRIPFVA
jgi:hypothetical protein